MLVNTHAPVVARISTHDAGTPLEFHTVNITESVPGCNGTVALFIDAQWHQWDSIVAAVTQYRDAAAVRDAGASAGTAAGSWVLDGNSSREDAQRLIDGYNDGDPAVMDAQPSPLSGEFAGDTLPRDVLALVGLDEDDDRAGELLDEYETAFADAFWAEVIRAATIIAAPEGD